MHGASEHVIDVAWSVCVSVCLCVRLLVTTASPTKTGKPIEMPFGVCNRKGLKEPCIRWTGDPVAPGKGAI